MYLIDSSKESGLYRRREYRLIAYYQRADFNGDLHTVYKENDL